MLKNHLLIAWRNLIKNKVYSFINIFGLTMGLCTCLVIATVVIDELSYDRQWSRGKDLYRIINIHQNGDVLDKHSYSALGLGPELKKDFPEVSEVCPMNTAPLQLKFNITDDNGIKLTCLSADSSVWKMLDIHVLSGNPRKYVQGQDNLMISQKIRDQFFPGIDPVGKIIYEVPTYGNELSPYLITGVFTDFPANTHLRTDVINITNWKPEPLARDLNGTFLQQYLLMKPDMNMKSFTAKVNKWYHEYTGNKKFGMQFQTIKDVYLHSDFNNSQQVRGSMRNVYIFSGVAMLLLLIACINFINLSTARSITRLKETGVRKILGAGSRQIILQFLTESLLFFMISAVLALMFYQPAIGFVEQFLGHKLEQTFFSHLSLLLIVAAIILVISLSVGIYPALILSRFKPFNALQGRLSGSRFSGQNRIRKGLVIIQFSISIIVLMSMIVVRQQVSFMDQEDLGFNKKDLLSIGFISWEKKGNAFKNELLRIPGVERASITGWTPSIGSGFMSREVDDPDHSGKKLTVWYIAGDVDLAATLGLQLQSGRLLSRDYQSDAFVQDSMDNLAHQHSLITASTAKILHIDKLNAIPDKMYTSPVGIVKDFHNESLKEPLGPTYIVAQQSPEYGGMLIRVKPGSENQVILSLQKIFKSFYPQKLLEINRVEVLLDAQYAAEAKLQQLFGFFSLLSMILASLGIFGLIVHSCTRRVKEIAVRKVLGAGIRSIVRLLTTDYVIMVLIAFLIASPIAWWLMGKWLQDFAYRIHISWWMFALAAIIPLLIAFLTVCIQAVKAAVLSPAGSLRAE